MALQTESRSNRILFSGRGRRGPRRAGLQLDSRGYREGLNMGVTALAEALAASGGGWYTLAWCMRGLRRSEGSSRGFPPCAKRKWVEAMMMMANTSEGASQRCVCKQGSDK